MDLETTNSDAKKGSFWDRLRMVLIVGWIFNFVSFIALTMYLGGDALNGKIENGHFFLGSHGIYTEVSKNIFTYSKVHATITLFAHIALFTCVLLPYLWGKLRK